MNDDAIPKMERMSQNIERVRYTLSHSAVRRAFEEYMDNKHDVVLPAKWDVETLGDGSITIVADYIVE